MKPALEFSRPIDDLLSKVLDGRLDDREQEALTDLLRCNPEARRLYHDHIALHALFHWKESGGAAEPVDNIGLGLDVPCLELSPSAAIASSVPLSGAWHGTAGYFTSHSFALSYLIAAVVLGVAMLASSVIYVSNPVLMVKDGQRIETTPRDRFILVGHVTGMNDCRWVDEGAGTMIGASVPLGRKYAMVSGLLEITYISGARVILEGPCTYKVDSRSGGYLSLGRLTARVEKKVASGQWPVAKNEGRGTRDEGHESANPKSPIPNPQSLATSHQPLAAGSSSLAPHPSSLFTVTTPTAVVTDLGTEFGVEVSENGDTTSHVFRGAVRVEATGEDSVVLRRDESVRVEKAGRVRETHHATGEKIELVRFTHPTTPPKFVRRIRELPKSLDLLDIVAGGNGLTARRERGIDPAVGLADPVFLAVIREGNRQYNPITWHRFIDGVFIPDGSGGAMPIDSAYHTFDGFPTTSGNGYGSIWSRGPDIKPEWTEQEKAPWFHAMGRAGQFIPESRGLLCLCPNAGITFDLEAMRRAYRDVVPNRFHAIAGMVDNRPRVPMADGMADLWIFVDGRLKLKREKLRPENGSVAVDIELGANDRFLTLASTDGGNGYENDYVVFGDPVLEMKSSMEDK